MLVEDIARHYPELLDFTYQVVNSLRGSQATDPRMVGCERLATKIFLHAATVNHLSRGTNVTLSNFKDGAHVIDFPSILVIARAILDAYLNLFEVFFEPTSEDVFEYRHAVYELKGFKLRELHIPESPDIALVLRVEQGIEEIEHMKERIRNTDFFKSLDPNQQAASLNGNMCPRRKLGERAKAAGFGEKTLEQVFAYWSGHTHGDALSVAQIVDADTDSRKHEYIRLGKVMVMMVLSHVILNYTSRFPEAQAVCSTRPNALTSAVRLAKLATSMP